MGFPPTLFVIGAPRVDYNYKKITSDFLRENGIEKARWMEAGAVISSHGGPGAIGIVGIEKK